MFKILFSRNVTKFSVENSQLMELPESLLSTMASLEEFTMTSVYGKKDSDPVSLTMTKQFFANNKALKKIRC